MKLNRVAMKPIYLDYNATTPVAPEVVDAMLPYLREHFGNASSAHAYGGAAHDALERARHVIGRLIGADPSSIIFTANGTESNNLASRPVTWRFPPKRRSQYFTTFVTPRSVRPVLPAHGVEREVEAGTKAESLRARRLHRPNLSDESGLAPRRGPPAAAGVLALADAPRAGR